MAILLVNIYNILVAYQLNFFISFIELQHSRALRMQAQCNVLCSRNQLILRPSRAKVQEHHAGFGSNQEEHAHGGTAFPLT